MIATALVEQIEELLREGKLSQRRIARQTGVSRGTISAIALGRRSSTGRNFDDEPGFNPPSGTPRRCPGCGGLVQMPCLLCYIRSLPKRRPKNEPHSCS